MRRHKMHGCGPRGGSFPEAIIAMGMGRGWGRGGFGGGFGGWGGDEWGGGGGGRGRGGRRRMFDSGELRLANAGHEPAFLRTADGAIVRLEPSGEPPLCILDGFEYTTVRRQLKAGEWICAVTDGVTEAMNKDGELYGAERLIALLATQRAESAPAAILAALRDDVRKFVGDTEPSDDLTVLCLRWSGPAA